MPTAQPRQMLVPLIVACGLFMENLDSTVLSTALPAIARSLEENPLHLSLAMTAYLFSLAVFIPISGWVADRFGARTVFRAAIVIFTIGSILCGLSDSLTQFVLARVFQGFGGAMMVPVGRLTMVRTFPKSQLVRVMSFVAIPSLIGPMLGPVAGGVIIHYFHWSVIFFLNVPIGLMGLYLVYRHLPDYRGDTPHRLDVAGLVLFGTGIALLSYVLEVFGEHFLSTREILGLLGLSIALLIGYGVNSVRTRFPLLRVKLFRIRTFFAAVVGSFVTRLGVGGIPFLLPLLYQIGLGWSPIQSGLMMMPQAIAAMSLKPIMPRILTRLGYRAVLIGNTVMLGIMILSFATIGAATPVWLIVIQVFCFGLFTSMQYTSMNTLVFADVPAAQSSGASTIASTAQQMSISFGVATASLLTAMFIPDRFASAPEQMIHGIHLAFLLLGAMTIVSVAVFARLRATDGSAVSQHKAIVTPANETDQFVSSPSLGER
jgi:EmrB/QacA subfamily drug resistance transporter